MKKFLSLLLALMMILALAACGGGDNKGDEGDKGDNGEPEKDDPAIVYTLGDYVVEYKGAKIAPDDEDYPSVIITIGFTNNSDFEASCSSDLYVKAEQAGELMNFSMLNANEYYSKEAAPGETIDVTFGYILNPVDYQGNYNYTDEITLTFTNAIADESCTIAIDPTTLDE